MSDSVLLAILAVIVAVAIWTGKNWPDSAAAEVSMLLMATVGVAILIGVFV